MSFGSASSCLLRALFVVRQDIEEKRVRAALFVVRQDIEEKRVRAALSAVYCLSGAVGRALFAVSGVWIGFCTFRCLLSTVHILISAVRISGFVKTSIKLVCHLHISLAVSFIDFLGGLLHLFTEFSVSVIRHRD